MASASTSPAFVHLKHSYSFSLLYLHPVFLPLYTPPNLQATTLSVVFLSVAASFFPFSFTNLNFVHLLLPVFVMLIGLLFLLLIVSKVPATHPSSCLSPPFSCCLSPSQTLSVSLPCSSVFCRLLLWSSKSSTCESSTRLLFLSSSCFGIVEFP